MKDKEQEQKSRRKRYYTMVAFRFTSTNRPSVPGSKQRSARWQDVVRNMPNKHNMVARMNNIAPPKRIRLRAILIISTFLLLTGCQPVSILFLKKNTHTRCPKYVSTQDALYRVDSCINAQELNNAIQDTQATRVDIITLSPKRTMRKAEDVSLDLNAASMIYKRRSVFDTLQLAKINKIILYERNPIKERRSEAALQLFCWTTMGALIDLAKFIDRKEYTPYWTISGVTLGIGFGSIFMLQKDIPTKRIGIAGLQENN